ncbi:protein O-linked-mannose beta-1,4-N-acetylglucosaminyltransferase 2-like [Haliotis rufescens]|uniref:protein O-linked-mannose beta-1,4-N-acetylglucosaminyltransferase 2-like n=1 Tax=Haliotis rufescens TaxID=6454 RepID=UPI00201EE1BD|nr:protein O-linked-mannose beta-1,4-N-acetylglucosaminyltransferase 2-like [Haliotis rufescens]
MPSLHNITHAVTLAVIATLLRKYLQLKFAYEDLELNCRLHHEDRTEFHDKEPDSLNHDYLKKGDQHERAPPPTAKVYGDSTRLWCSGHDRSSRICKFENLCYNPQKDDFVFVHGPGSFVEGADMQSVRHGLLDLSTVQGHTTHVFRAADAPSRILKDASVHWVEEETLVFNRFKPDNIMHVIHDDILPLHHTLQLVSLGANRFSHHVQLVVLEGWDMGEFESIYSYFTSYDILTKDKIGILGEMVCFRSGHVGISKTTTWYQYGFDSPQAPLEGLQVTSQHIRTAAQYLLSESTEQCQICDTGEYIVLISRRLNRLILNEVELTMAIARETGFKVVVIGFESHSVGEMMKIVHSSRGIIGMHGSLMILSTFLKPGSFVIELFPYAINPDSYTPFKTLAEIRGMQLVYKAWANQNREDTIMHSDWPADLGGILDLPKEEQDDIINQSEIPLHLCCEDPSWLFHIYQDTKVDIPALTVLLKQSLSESTVRLVAENQLTPSPVRQVVCDVGSDGHRVTLSWERPWNVMYLDYKTLEYEIWLQNSNTESTLSLIVGDVTSHTITDHVTKGILYNVWVRSVLDQQTQGQFSGAIKCPE